MKKVGLWLAVVLVIIIISAVFSVGGCKPAAVTETTPIKIGHGTFWTGPFAFVGPPFAAITDFTLGIVNQDPPLGQAVTVLHSDGELLANSSGL
jgi:hypothetical protein